MPMYRVTYVFRGTFEDEIEAASRDEALDVVDARIAADAYAILMDDMLSDEAAVVIDTFADVTEVDGGR